MSENQKEILKTQLWKIAELLRGRMNASEYQNYILGFIFYKYLSEKQEIYADRLLEADGFRYIELHENVKDAEVTEYLAHIREHSVENLGFFIPPSELFGYIVKKGRGELGGDTFILEDLKLALSNIENSTAGFDSEEDFAGLFEDVDLTSSKLGRTESQKNQVIVEVLKLLDEVDFEFSDIKSDLLGDAYEYLISEFAASAGKKGGEFYTPAQVSRILSRIVTHDKKRIKSVYDPTCGSGSLLIHVGEFAEVAHYYGQELNPTTYNLARMNMILHNLQYSRFSIKQGDTLEEDHFPELKAEAVVANPPYSAHWKGSDNPLFATDERFAQYGALAPKKTADYAFVCHMLYHLADNGTMAVLMPHGVLFRGAAEGKIRRYIVERLNYLDAVIGLPPNLFFGTSIPVCIMVFKKCREAKNDILFIDASKEYRPGKNQNHLDDEHIEKIVTTYTERKELDKYSHRATMEEIIENDYNLNIPRYVDTFEEEEPVDIEAAAHEIVELEAKEKEIDEKIAAFCKELGIEPPFGGEK